MLVLAFDTSSPAVTVALADFGAPHRTSTFPQEHDTVKVSQAMAMSGRRMIAANRHGELLAPLIADVLNEANVEPGEVDAIGVGLGPGPFTGLRVGIVTAKSMGDALGIPTYGACSLDIIASNQELQPDGPFAVVTDARRKQVYWRLYDERRTPISEPDVATPVDLAEQLRGSISMVIGAGADLYPDVLSEFARPSVVARPTGLEEAGYPSIGPLAGSFCERALAAAPSERLTPLYLRRPDAVPPGKPKQVTPA